MAPSTRSKTNSLPSGVRKRAAESDTESQPDASSTSIQSRAKTRKRTKVAHDEAEVQVSKRTTRAPRQRVQGLLKALPDMPLDVLEEIFMMCDLATLISVARTKKAFCRLLQSPGYAHVWREAFARDEDIPEAPEGWSHVKWAGLLYGGKTCASCGFPTADKVSFGILKRLCNECICKDMIDCTSGTFPNGLRLFPGAVEDVMPTAFIQVAKVYTYGKAISYVFFAYETDLDDYLSNLRMAVPKPDHDGELAFIAQEKTRFSSRREHALRAERWQKAKLDREAKDLEDARKARKKELKNAKDCRHHEIMKRIRLAGYDTEMDVDGVLKLKGVNVSQPLTDGDWAQLWISIEPLLKTNKATRLAADSEYFLKERRSHAQYRFRVRRSELTLTQLELCIWPSEDQCLEFEPLASFLKLDADMETYDRPAKEWFDSLSDILTSTVEAIRHTMHELDLDLMRKVTASADASSQANDPDRVLELATSVLVIRKTETSTDDDVHVYFGREILLAGRRQVARLAKHPYSDPLPSTFSDIGGDAVRYILKMCKLKPTTTILELDAHDAHFICTACEPTMESPTASQWGQKVKCRPVLSWRTAVEHACHVHGDGELNPLQLRSLTKSEQTVLAAKSYKKIARYSSYDIKHLVPTCFRCNHCWFDTCDIPEKRRSKKYKGGLLTLKEVLKHLQNQHNITLSAAKEGVDYWYHPRLPRGLLKSTMTEFRLIV